MKNTALLTSLCIAAGFLAACSSGTTGSSNSPTGYSNLYVGVGSSNPSSVAICSITGESCTAQSGYSVPFSFAFSNGYAFIVDSSFGAGTGESTVVSCQISTNPNLNKADCTPQTLMSTQTRSITVNRNYAYITQYGSSSISVSPIENGNLTSPALTIDTSAIFTEADMVTFNNNTMYIAGYDGTNYDIASCSLNSSGTISDACQIESANGAFSGNFDYTTNIAVNNGYLYVPSGSNDENNIAVCAINSDGSIASTCTQESFAGVYNNYPSGIAFNNGQAYISYYESGVNICTANANGSLTNCGLAPSSVIGSAVSNGTLPIAFY